MMKNLIVTVLKIVNNYHNLGKVKIKSKQSNKRKKIKNN